MSGGSFLRRPGPTSCCKVSDVSDINDVSDFGDDGDEEYLIKKSNLSLLMGANRRPASYTVAAA